MSELKLKNCPFCNCTMSVRSNRDWHRPEGDHEDHCPVDDTVLMYPATDIGLSALVNCWNTRVTQPEATKPAQDLGERNTQCPLLIARIKRYKEAFGCSTAEAKEACEYGRDLNSDQTAFVSPTKKDLSAAILALPLPQPVGHVEYSVPGEPMTRICAGYSPEQIRQLLKAAAALASPADALAEGDDDPIGDLQAEARQEKLDDFIASMNPNPATENKVQAVGDVLAERERQKQQEGWTPERDDKYIDCELARAAATYSLCTDPEQIKVCGAPVWPWPIYWWKPTTYRRNLVKAGALILAEIERLDRAAIQAQKDGHD